MSTPADGTPTALPGHGWVPPLVRPVGEERFWHGETGTCACGRTVTWDADCQHWSVPYGFGNPPPFTFWCDDDIGPRGRTIHHRVPDEGHTLPPAAPGPAANVS